MRAVDVRINFLDILVQVVVIQTQTGREVVLLGEISLKHQLGIGILLVHIITLIAVAAILHVHRGIAHQGDIGAMLLVKHEGMLHIGLVAVGGYINKVGVVGMRMMACLTALTIFLQ